MTKPIVCSIRLARKNVMIKIPASQEGLPAIEEAISRGININVTMIFSIENYEQVAEAFIKGLERRAAAGQNVDHIASVASFFVSRVDSMIDSDLDYKARHAARLTKRPSSRTFARPGCNCKCEIGLCKV